MLPNLKSHSRRIYLAAIAISSFYLWSIVPVLSEEQCTRRSLFEFRPGIIVDEDRARVYLMNPEGGIDAVDLASGHLLWTTAQAAKPIIMAEDLLIAQVDIPDLKNILHLMFLNTKKGGESASEAKIELPTGVRVSVEDGPSTSFRTDAWIHGKFTFIAWTFSKGYVGGPPPKGTGVHTVSGTVRIDSRTGESRLLNFNDFPPPARPGVPNTIIRKAASRSHSGQLWNTGCVVARVERIPGKREKGITLLRWSCATGEALPDVKLYGADYTLRYPSANQKHLLASKADYANRPPWHWLIFSIDSGKRVAEINMESPGARFFVGRNHLIYESPLERRLVAGEWLSEPLRLQAIDLESNNKRWSRPIRDTVYRGSSPP
jgi:hypothetical protein